MEKETTADWKKYVAEFLGTLFLVLLGCGTAIFTNVNLVATALAFGLAVVAMAYTFGPISGGHFNPAVSTGALITKKIGWKDYIIYIICQIIGAITAGAILFGMTKLAGITGSALGSNAYAAAPDTAGAIGLTAITEILLTFLFVLTILGVTSKPENSKNAGLIIGLTLTLVHLMAILMLGGTSVNPARSLGVAIFAGGSALTEIWAFIVFPLVGAALAGIVALFMFRDETADTPKTVTHPEPKSESKSETKTSKSYK